MPIAETQSASLVPTSVRACGDEVELGAIRAAPTLPGNLRRRESKFLVENDSFHSSDTKQDALRKREARYQNLNHATKAQDRKSATAVLSTFITHVYCAPTFSTLPVVTLLAIYLNMFYESTVTAQILYRTE